MKRPLEALILGDTGPVEHRTLPVHWANLCRIALTRFCFNVMPLAFIQGLN